MASIAFPAISRKAASADIPLRVNMRAGCAQETSPPASWIQWITSSRATSRRSTYPRALVQVAVKGLLDASGVAFLDEKLREMRPAGLRPPQPFRFLQIYWDMQIPQPGSEPAVSIFTRFLQGIQTLAKSFSGRLVKKIAQDMNRLPVEFRAQLDSANQFQTVFPGVGSALFVALKRVVVGDGQSPQAFDAGKIDQFHSREGSVRLVGM